MYFNVIIVGEEFSRKERAWQIGEGIDLGMSLKGPLSTQILHAL